MPRLRLPRFGLADPDGDPDGEHDRLMLVAQVGGFIVLIGVVVSFVLIAGANAGEGIAVRQPPVPAITDVGGPPRATATAAPAPPASSAIAAPVDSQAAVVHPAPEPKPKPRPNPAPPPVADPPADPGPGGSQVADPGDRCAPEGARAFSRHRHFPLVCHDGRWQLAASGGR